MSRNFQTNLILGGDPRGGLKALRQVRGEMDRTRSHTRDLSKSFRNFSAQTLGLNSSLMRLSGILGVSLSFGAAVRGVQQLASDADGIGKLAARTNFAIERLQEFRFAAQQTGATSQQFDESISRLSRRIGIFAETGGGPAAAAIERLGLGIRNASGEIRATDDLFLEITQRIAEMTTAQQKSAVASEFFGDEAGPKLVNLLSQGADGIEELGRQAQATGSILSAEAVNAAEAYNDNMNRLRLQLLGVASQFFEGLIPALESTAEQFIRTANASSPLEEAGRAMGTALNVAARAAVVVTTTFQAAVQAVISLEQVLRGAVMQIIAPLEGLVRTLQVATTALLERDFSGAAAAFKEIGANISGATAEARALTEEGLSALREIPGIFGAGIDSVMGLYNALKQTGREGQRTGDVLDGLGGGDGGLGELTAQVDAFNAQMDKMAHAADGPVATALRENAEILRDYNQLVDAGAKGLMERVRVEELLAENLEQARLEERTQAMSDLAAEMERIADIRWGIESLAASFAPLSDEMLRLGETIQFIDDALNEGVIAPAQAGFLKMGATADATFNAMKSGMDRASKEYKRIEQAQKVVNIAMGIAAILQQGMGDPYTAIPRMAAMAAMVASLGVDAGRIGSGGSSGAASRQQMQGTGSVLGDASADSETIINALEVTANATQDLVGINTGMLRALQQLQSGISGASGMLARGAGDVDFAGVGVNRNIFDGMGLIGDIITAFDPLGIMKWVGKWLGGSSKIVDEGIEIVGGTIADLLDGTLVGAFQTIRYKKWKFGSKKTREQFEQLPDDIAAQFTLIFDAITDSVAEAALALGLNVSDIEAAMAAFEVEATKISLMDLSAEEQEAELLAVFSRIFDDLAREVIPFIGQFQQVGEGLGETLVRVATSVQVTEEAIYRLGLSIGELDPEQMAQVSVGLIEAAGGVEQFLNQMQKFVQKFAPEAHRIEIAQRDMTGAFEQLGLALPGSREGFWELLGAIDATTEAGQAQIATLLSLTDAADLYYSTLEDVAKEREALEVQLLRVQGDTVALRELELAALDPSNRALQLRIWAIEDEARAAEEAARVAEEAAQAAADAAAAERERGRALRDMMKDIDRDILRFISPTRAAFADLSDELADVYRQALDLGASEMQLMRVRELQARSIARFTADLQISILELADQLFGVEDSFTDVGSAIVDATANVRDAVIRNLEQIDEWLNRSLLGNESPLTPTERLGEARQQFETAFNAAMGGDFGALENLPALADALLGEGSSFFGTSTSQYRELFDMVRSMMEQASGVVPPEAMKPPTFGQVETIKTETSAFRQRLDELERMQAAWDLGEQMTTLAELTGQTPAELARELGFSDRNMRDLLEMLGHDVSTMTGDELSTYFNDVVNEISGQNPLLQAIEQTSKDMVWAVQVLETNLWYIGDALVQILEQLGGTYDPYTPPAEMQFAAGGAVPYTGNALVHGGEYVVPRNGALVSSDPEQKAISERQDERLRNIERILARGFGGVIDEERRTRQAMIRRTETARA